MFRTCSICRMDYVAPVDNREHTKFHKQWEEAIATLNYTPANYTSRENAKGRASYVTNDETLSLDIRIDAALTIIRARFDRSLISAIAGGYWKEHPTFESYVAMVHMQDIPQPLWKVIHERYGYNTGHMESGVSYWTPNRVG